jgi:hypothetical protein
VFVKLNTSNMPSIECVPNWKTFDRRKSSSLTQSYLR